MRFREWLEEHGACDKGIDWVGNRSARRVWDECEHPGWMLWFIVEIFDEDVWKEIHSLYQSRFRECSGCGCDSVYRDVLCREEDGKHYCRCFVSDEEGNTILEDNGSPIICNKVIPRSGMRKRADWLRKSVKLPKRIRLM